MYDTSVFFKDDSEDPKPVSTILVVKLKGFQFKYKLEEEDFVPEPDFKTFMWKKPEEPEDRGNESVGGAADLGTNKRQKNTSNPSPNVSGSGGAVPMQTANISAPRAVLPVGSMRQVARSRHVRPSAEPGLLGRDSLAAQQASPVRDLWPALQAPATWPLHLLATGSSPSPSSPGDVGLGGRSSPVAPGGTLAAVGRASAHGGDQPGGLPMAAAGKAAAHLSSPSFSQRLEGVPTPPSPPPVVSPMVRPSAMTTTAITGNGTTMSPPYRRSARHPMAADGASRMDEDSLSKAMRLQAARNLDFTPGYFSVCTLTPGVVFSSETGTPRPLYGGMFASGAGGEGYFIPSWVAA